MIYILHAFSRLWEALRRWHYANRPPPRVVVPGADPLSDAPGEHNSHFVSRHAIAESGLTCPSCKEVAAQRADFSGVRVDQRWNEVLQCGACGAWLIASPDTEHGDHLLEYDQKIFHRFVRKTKAESLKEQYSEEVRETDQAALSVNRVRLGSEAAARVAKEEARQADPKRRDTIIKAQE